MPASIPSQFSAPHNHLLTALPPDEYDAIAPHLEFLPLESGSVLCEIGSPIESAYFPLTAMISLVSIMENGATTEISLVGKEGMIGLPIILGGELSLNQIIVQVSGTALRLNPGLLIKQFQQGKTFQKIMLLYTQARLIQVGQNAACNRQHTIEERLARWLLSVEDCLASDELHLTQEFIAQMLGIRRSGVTVAASLLQERGIIRYSRGKITILDVVALESASCECYKIVKREYFRLLGQKMGRNFS